MKRKTKLFSFTIIFGIIAIGSIICNIFWIEFARPLVRSNPILDLLSRNGFSFIIDNELQSQEAGSYFLHYNLWAYCIHFVSCLIVGSLIDVVKNKLFFGKVSELN
ncbi:hypothetical protein [Bacillus sp. FJAT-22090]|uniref:hypothetical protein n=1 Tax=Bacillus sp. FJAT-22090 TaxID=1581038 RepID=UPI0011A12908|nr:hypothetical protein [Bacillus sp. FJAT-22090]